MTETQCFLLPATINLFCDSQETRTGIAIRYIECTAHRIVGAGFFYSVHYPQIHADYGRAFLIGRLDSILQTICGRLRNLRIHTYLVPTLLRGNERVKTDFRRFFGVGDAQALLRVVVAAEKSVRHFGEFTLSAAEVLSVRKTMFVISVGGNLPQDTECTEKESAVCNKAILGVFE